MVATVQDTSSGTIKDCSLNALRLIAAMDATELRHYLRDLISDNVKVGIEILKNK